MPHLSINTQFDSGAVMLIENTRTNEISVRLRGDNASEFSQWFHFALNGIAGQKIHVKLCGLKSSAYPKGWNNYQPVISFDRENWFRVAANFDGEDVLSFAINMSTSCVYIAYFEPYSYEKYLNYIAKVEANNAWIKCEMLGATLQGRTMHLLQVTKTTSTNLDEVPLKKIWLTARQHPGETMASWFVEGFLNTLLDESNRSVQHLLTQCVFYIVPHMNPDGAALGNLRTNFVGTNLNREWSAPSLENSPEVFHTIAAMKRIGVDLFLDIHGDETLPYVFLSGSEGVPNYGVERAKQEDNFKAAWQSTSPDFQDKFGYDKSEPGKANMTLATSWVAQQFNCLAYTVEMPFKDNANAPDHQFGWSGKRSHQLGASCVEALALYLKNKI